MRKYTKTVGALAAASALVAGYASAEIEGEVHVGYHSMYEFRFVDLGSDLVEAGVDLSYAISENWGLKAGAWYGSVNDSQTIGGNFNELDLYAAVGTTLGPVELELGYIYYTYPDTAGADTQEVYLSAFVGVGAGFSTGAVYYYDFDSNNGWYLQPEVRWSHEFNDCLGLNLSAGVGFADGLDYQVSSFGFGSADGFQGWFLKAELPWKFRENMTLAPYLKYTDADSDLAGDINSFEGGQDNFFGGVKIAVSF